MKTNKVIFGILSAITIVFILYAFTVPNDNEIKTTGKILIANASELIGSEMTCTDLKKVKNYLLAYQQLYKEHSSLLGDKQDVLDDILEGVKNSGCDKNAGFGTGLQRGTWIRTSGGGGSGNVGRIILPSDYIAMFYMSESSRKAYYNNLPLEVKEEFSQYEALLQNIESQDLVKLKQESNLVKSFDQANYVNWYFQNQNTILNSVDESQLLLFKSDFKEKVLEFEKQN